MNTSTPVAGPLQTNEYRCDLCGGIYGRSRSDEECEAEELENFGFNAVVEDRAILCDDCYQSFMAGWHAGGLPEAKA